MGGGRRRRKDHLPNTEPTTEFERQIMDDMDRSYFSSIRQLSTYLATKRDAWADYLWPHKKIDINWPIVILAITAIALIWLAKQ